MRDLTIGESGFIADKCCNRPPMVARELNESNKIAYALHCEKCGRYAWASKDLATAVSHWDKSVQSEINAISALTHSELIHTGKNTRRKWAHTVVLILAVGGVMTFLWELLK